MTPSGKAERPRPAGPREAEGTGALEQLPEAGAAPNGSASASHRVRRLRRSFLADKTQKPPDHRAAATWGLGGQPGPADRGGGAPEGGWPTPDKGAHAAVPAFAAVVPEFPQPGVGRERPLQLWHRGHNSRDTPVTLPQRVVPTGQSSGAPEESSGGQKAESNPRTSRFPGACARPGPPRLTRDSEGCAI